MATYTVDKIEYSSNVYVLQDSGALQLTGGQVTGPVTFGDTITVDNATISSLVVNGNASFANNIQANTINGVAVGSSPKFTDTNTEVSTLTLASGSTAGTTLAYGGKYTLTAGSKTVSFTMPASDNTNTTYSLNGALSSHKFTSTLTAGGSGSGTSTSDFTLAAGTGITITDDTSARKMTIACSVTNTDTKVTQTYSATNNNYPMLMAGTANITSTASRGEDISIVNNAIYGNPATGTLTATTFVGALTGTASGNLTSSSTLNAAKLSGTIPTSCYTNSNTTYTLTNALSSHKFTWTFTAGGSGSGSTTTTAELVAGTGITLTDDTTNKKITIASSVTNTDEKVKQTNTTTSAAYELLFSYTADNTERTEGARKTSTLTYNPSTKALSTGGTVNGYTLAAASAKGVDTSIASGSSSANLPTSAAVASYVSSNATQVQIVRW